MATVISVENLGKKYTIGHRRAERYLTLRDTITQKSKDVAKRLLHPFLASSGQPLIGLSTTEDLWALEDVSFEIKEGERVGIIGRNGAGKSTLLKVLSRITEPSKGKIAITGRVASLLEVGTGFHPELTGRENIFLNGAVLGMSKAEIRKKFDEIVEFAELEKFLDTPVKRYSTGMQVRLAFAVSAHLEPEILAVDEVLAVGDAQFQRKCLGKMAEVGTTGRTVLFVSHNLTAIRTLCDRAIWLRDGKLVVDESSSDAVSKYLADTRESSLAREWKNENTAPQNASAVLRSVRICDDKGNLFGQIYTDTAFNIEIEYKVRRDGAFVGLTFILYDNENNCVFSSINNHETNWYGRPMPAGIYKSICKIPANFLNDEWFSVAVNVFGKSFTDARMYRDVLKLGILDGASLRGDYYGSWAGVVRPALDWSTTKLEL